MRRGLLRAAVSAVVTVRLYYDLPPGEWPDARVALELPQTSPKAPSAMPRATFPAAGTVVTEMKTPERPPTFAEVSDRTPTAPHGRVSPPRGSTGLVAPTPSTSGLRTLHHGP